MYRTDANTAGHAEENSSPCRPTSKQVEPIKEAGEAMPSRTRRTGPTTPGRPWSARPERGLFHSIADHLNQEVEHVSHEIQGGAAAIPLGHDRWFVVLHSAWFKSYARASAPSIRQGGETSGFHARR